MSATTGTTATGRSLLGLTPQTYSLIEAAQILGVSGRTLYRRARETGEIAPGVPVLDFGPQCKRVSRVQVERLLGGEVAP